MFSRLARLAARFRVIVVLAWVALAAGLFLTAPSLSSVGVTDESQFLPQDTESAIAGRLLSQQFARTAGEQASSAFIIIHRAGGLTEADMQAARQIRDWLASPAAPPVVAQVTSVFDVPAGLSSRFVSADNSTMLISLGFSTTALAPASDEAINRIRDYLHGTYPGLEVYLSGDVGLFHDLFASVQATIARTTLVTIILVIVLLLVIYRSPVAILIPLITIGVSYLVARGILGFMAQAGVPISTLAEAYLVVIVFGVGTDYCLFIVSRYREELARGARQEAEVTALSRIGPVIAASALTVIVAFLSLGISRFGMNRTMGYALAIGVGLTLLAGITLTPALIALFGRFVFWPTRRFTLPAPHRFGWLAIGRWVAAHPWLVIVPVLILLLVPYLALPQVSLTNDIVSQMPSSTESVQGFNRFKQGFPAGEFSPLYLLVQRPAGQGFGPADQGALGSMAAALQAVPGVAFVDYASAPAPQLEALTGQVQALVGQVAQGTVPPALGTTLTAAGQLLGGLPFQYPGLTQSANFTQAAGALQQLQALLPQLQAAAPAAQPALFQQLGQGLGALAASLGGLTREFRLEGDTPFVAYLYATYFSQDRSIARINVALSGDPFANTALDTVRALRQTARDTLAADSLGGWQAYLGGEAASRQDIMTVNNRDFLWVSVLVTVGIFVVIALLLRAIVAPLYMVATVLLNYGATIGLAAWIFIDILGKGSIIYLIPLFVFVILVALGADYNIFLMSRLREESGNCTNREAVARALGHTGGVITACGVILAGTFATLMTSALQVVFQIGAAIALGILVDTFIVRALLVPAIATVVGRWNWWPSRLCREMKGRPAPPPPSPGL